MIKINYGFGILITNIWVTTRSFWKIDKRSHASVTCKGIMQAVDALRVGFEMRLHFGTSSFWFSEWTGKGPLCHLVDYVHIS